MNKAIEKFWRDHGSTVLTVASIAGTTLVGYFTYKGTIKAIEVMEENPNVTKKEIFKQYIPAVVSELFTIGSIIGCKALTDSQKASLMAGYSTLFAAYQSYRKETKKQYGEEADTLIMTKIAEEKINPKIKPKNGKVLFFDELSEVTFEAYPEDVLKAEYEMNKRLNTQGYVDSTDWYDLLEIEAPEGAEFVGWASFVFQEEDEVPWIDYQHELTTMGDDLQCIIIHTPVRPVIGYDDVDDYPKE